MKIPEFAHVPLTRTQAGPIAAANFRNRRVDLRYELAPDGKRKRARPKLPLPS